MIIQAFEYIAEIFRFSLLPYLPPAFVSFVPPVGKYGCFRGIPAYVINGIIMVLCGPESFQVFYPVIF